MKILCAGPTSISKEVMEAMGKSLTNPDLDPEYINYHEKVEKKISKILNTEATSFIMLAEAMAALEGSCASLVEEGDRVLVISNGFFAEGFKEFVEFYRGEAVEYKDNPRQGINLEKLEKFLEEDHNFKIATMVHCETPTGISNDIKGICSLLKKYDILTIVDTVSGMGAEEFNFDEFQVDVALGGSQKVISAPVGLSLVTISEGAKEKIKNRKTPVKSYYMNYKNYYDFDGVEKFPYTMNENLVYALDIAIDRLLEKDSIALHEKYAKNTRDIFTKAGFELYAKDSFANSVTAILVPEGHRAEEILAALRKRNILISKGIGDLSEKIIRIGHMGNNISYKNFKELYENLDEVFKELKINTNISLKDEFIKTMK